MIYQRPSAMSVRDRDIAMLPIAVDTPPRPFWSYVAGWVVFFVALAIVGNIIEVLV